MNQPYSPPAARLDSQNDASYEPSIWSFKGRIGRLRYLAFATIVCILPMMVIGILAAMIIPMVALGKFGGMAAGMALIGGLVWLGLIVLVFGLMRRRLNDLGRSGWFMLLMFVPIVNFLLGLYILFAPGDSGGNAYGPPPSPNPTWVTVVAVLCIVLNLIVPLATIPAYMEFEKKAAESRNRLNQPVAETLPAAAPASAPAAGMDEAVKPTDSGEPGASGGGGSESPTPEPTPGPRN